MASNRRPVQDGEIRITQSHLAALGVAMVSSAALAFLLGMQVGKLGGVQVEVKTTAPFTPSALSQDHLEAMLREVELARSATAPSTEADLSFPKPLTGASDLTALAEGTGDKDASAEVDSQPLADSRPPAPVSLDGDVPTTGWSVQVATTREVEVARERRDELIEAGWPAYVVSSFVDGQSWYRIRVGGFADAAEADVARAKLSLLFGHDSFALTGAP
jgi:cell division septation protein DedD